MPPKSSTSGIVLPNEEASIQAVKTARWVVFGLDETTKNGINMLAHSSNETEPTSGLAAEFIHLLQPTRVLYILLRVAIVSNAYGKATWKYLFVSWIGSSVKALQRGSAASNHALLHKFCEVQLACQVQEIQGINHTDDLSDANIFNKLKGNEKSRRGSGAASAAKTSATTATTAPVAGPSGGAKKTAAAAAWGKLAAAHNGTATGPSYAAVARGTIAGEEPVTPTKGKNPMSSLPNTASPAAATAANSSTATPSTLSGRVAKLVHAQQAHAQTDKKLISPRSNMSSPHQSPRSTMSSPRGMASPRDGSTSAPRAAGGKPKPNPTQKFEFLDRQDLESKLVSIRDDAKACKWVMMGYNETGAIYDVASGAGDLHELAAQLEPTSINYAVLRVSLEKFALPDKILFITWVGSRVSTLVKGKSSSHRSLLYDICNRIVTLAGEIQALSKDDLSESAVHSKLTGNTGKISTAASTASSAQSSAKKSTWGTLSAAVKLSGVVPKTAVTPAPAAGDSILSGTDLKLEDEARVVGLLKQMSRQDALHEADINWLALAYDNSTKNKLMLVGQGNTGLAGLHSELKDDEIRYVLLKMHVGETGYAKFVFIPWIGKKVKFAQRGAVNVHKSKLITAFNTVLLIAAEHSAATMEDLSEATLLQKLNVKGTGRTATGSSSSRATPGSSSSSSVANNSLATSFGGKSSNIKWVDEPQLQEDLKDLRSDSSPTNWILFDYVDGQDTTIRVLQKGENGIAEFQPLLKSDRVHYVLLKMFVDETGYGGSPKVILITWVGPSVKYTLKAKSSQHRMLLSQYAQKVLAVAGEYQATSEDELTEAAIRGKLTGSKGKIEVETSDGSRVKVPTYAAVASGQASAPKPTQFKAFGGRSSNLMIEDEAVVMSTLESMRKGGEFTWLLLGYCEDDPYKVKMINKGAGTGLDDVKPLLLPQSINYCLLRMNIHSVWKFAIITWVGAEADNFHKARSSGHRINLYEYCSKKVAIGGEFQALSLDDVDFDIVYGKVAGSKGAVGQQEGTVSSYEERLALEAKRKQQQAAQLQKKQLPSSNILDKRLEFAGEDEVKPQLLQFRNNTASTVPLRWMKIAVEGKDLRQIRYVDQNEGTYEQLQAELDRNAVLYFMLAVNNIEGGYGANVTQYLCVQWIGTDLKALVKARANEINPSLYEFIYNIAHPAGQLLACQVEDVTHLTVMEKLTGSRIRKQNVKLAKSKPKHLSDLGKKGGAGTVLQYEDVNAILAAFDDLVDEQTGTDWILFGYSEDGMDTVKYLEKGSGGLNELKTKMHDEKILFAGYSLTHDQHGYGLEKTWYGLLSWIGLEVSPMEKALCSHHWNQFSKDVIYKKIDDIAAFFKGRYQTDRIDDLNERNLKRQLQLNVNEQGGF